VDRFLKIFKNKVDRFLKLFHWHVFNEIMFRLHTFLDMTVKKTFENRSALCTWHDRRVRKSCKNLARVNSYENLVRVSYWLATRFFCRKFLPSNRSWSIPCKFLERVFGSSFSCEFIVHMSWALASIMIRHLKNYVSCFWETV